MGSSKQDEMVRYFNLFLSDRQNGNVYVLKIREVHLDVIYQQRMRE